jgi:transposase-like protein
MKTHESAPDYKGYRFPSEITSHAVWLYFRFSFSFRDVEELLAQRGIVITYETVRQWCLTFGQSSANELRRRPRCGDKWHLDEVVLTIRGKNISSGKRWIKRGTCWISWCRAGATNRQLKDSFASCSKGCTTFRA